MAKNLVYEKTMTTKIKAVGTIDFENGIITVDGEDIKLSTLFTEFDKQDVELTMAIKEKEEMYIPYETDDNE